MLTTAAAMPADAASGQARAAVEEKASELSSGQLSAARASMPDPDAPPSDSFEKILRGPTVPEGKAAGTSSTSAAAVCTFIQRVDYVHISGTSTDRTAQSHGNWDNVDCRYSLADVTTQIDRRNPVLLYQAVGAPGKARLAPNPRGLTSGGAGRVTARYRCNGLAKADFRSWTSVDIVGYADAPNRVYSPANPLSCG